MTDAQNSFWNSVQKNTPSLHFIGSARREGILNRFLSDQDVVRYYAQHGKERLNG